jgi:hypothetical protein
MPWRIGVAQRLLQLVSQLRMLGYFLFVDEGNSVTNGRCAEDCSCAGPHLHIFVIRMEVRIVQDVSVPDYTLITSR